MLVSDSLTHSLTDCRLVNLIDVTLACEDANSKLVEVVTVADVDAQKCVDDNLEAEVWSKSQIFVQTLSTRFGQDFEVEAQPRFRS